MLNGEHVALSEEHAATKATLEGTASRLEEKTVTLLQKDADLREAIGNVSKMQQANAEVLAHERTRASGFEEEARELRTRVQLAEAASERASADADKVAGELEACRAELGSVNASLATSNSERERLAIETAEQKDGLAARDTSVATLTGQLDETRAAHEAAQASVTEKSAQLEELDRARRDLEVEYRSYQEHHSSSNNVQLTAISELKCTVDRLSDQVEKKGKENTQVRTSPSQRTPPFPLKTSAGITGVTCPSHRPWCTTWQVSGSLAAQAAHNEALEAKVREAEALRRALHNQIQELKGNIRVFVRVRPGAADAPKAIEMSSDSKLTLTRDTEALPFGFDKVRHTHPSSSPFPTRLCARLWPHRIASLTNWWHRIASLAGSCLL